MEVVWTLEQHHALRVVSGLLERIDCIWLNAGIDPHLTCEENAIMISHELPFDKCTALDIRDDYDRAACKTNALARDLLDQINKAGDIIMRAVRTFLFRLRFRVQKTNRLGRQCCLQ